MKTRSKLASLALCGAVAAPVIGLSASSAQAASYPTCDNVKYVWLTDSVYTLQPFYTATGSRNCVMGYGAQSNGVRHLQKAIDYCYENIGVDGIYGNQTKNAVYRVQEDESIGRDGVYGPETRKAMWWPRYQRGDVFLGCVKPHK
ncbi:peptidoglycan-binding domain-containing protein [Streptomyces sp. UG1]|uniref:peptidoglycan-binding domain-containing protein n=1 Tax=Streptomyces sp. UG1 TaxID=3417652 RepID=UPI003CFA57D7